MSAIAAITWVTIASPSGRSWLICGWANRDDPEDPTLARIHGYAQQDPTLLSRLGPYVLTNLDMLPAVEPRDIDEPDRDWETAPDGRYVIADATARTHVCAAIAYAFWRIQAQPITVAAPAPRRTRQLVHDTRVVMLRRTSALTEPGDGHARWHYRVRFIVRGH